jgi:hypothetical protein
VDLHVHQLGAGSAIAGWGPTLIRVIDGGPTRVADMEQIHALASERLAELPALGLLAVVHHGSPVPEPAAIRRVAQLFGPIQERLSVGMAIVGLGFWASASRTIAATMARARPRNIVVEPTVEATAERMALDLVGLDAEGLVAAYEQLHARMQAARRAPP